ncbi:hypothetical protein NUSPORA_02994 [Nucleospora cyclopteri]
MIKKEVFYKNRVLIYRERSKIVFNKCVNIPFLVVRVLIRSINKSIYKSINSDHCYKKY